MAVTILIYDTTTDQFLFEIPESGAVPYGVIGDRNVTFVVQIDDPALQAQVGSVRLSTGELTRVESVAPYALFGDRNGDFFGGRQFEAGTLDFTVELFTGAGARGTSLLTETRTIDIVDPNPRPEPQPEPEPAPEPNPEPVPGPTPVPGDLTVSLVDTDADTEVAALADGDSLAAALLDGKRLTLAVGAEDLGIEGAVGSVRLTFTGGGETVTRTESAEPYALFGDRNGDFFGGRELAAGDYTLRIEAFSGAGGSGGSLGTQSLAFSVTGTAPSPEPEPGPLPEPGPQPGPGPQPDPQPSDVKVSLIDANNDREVASLADGAELDVAAVSGKDLTLAVGAEELGIEGVVGSVRLTFTGGGETVTRTESAEPYALFGDKDGNFFGGQKLTNGDYTLTLEIFSEARGAGTKLATETVAFSVTGALPEAPAPTPEDGSYYAGIADGDDYRFKIQVEDAGETPGGDWHYVSGPDGDGNQQGAQGGYYLYGDEASTSNNNRVNADEVLEYRIFVPVEETGSYTFYMRSSRDRGGEGDKKNDVWLNVVREQDDVSIDTLLQSSNEPHPTSNGFIKVIGAQYTSWKSFTGFDGEPFNSAVRLDFSKAGFYTVKLAGRSEGFHIDSFELVKGSRPTDDAADSPLVNGGDGLAEVLAFAQMPDGPMDPGDGGDQPLSGDGLAERFADFYPGQDGPTGPFSPPGANDMQNMLEDYMTGDLIA